MSGNKKQTQQNFEDNPVYSDEEESDVLDVPERGVSKMSDVSAESGIASGSSARLSEDASASSGIVSGSSPRLSEDSQMAESTKDMKNDAKGSTLTGFYGYVASKLSPKKRFQGEATTTESPKNKSPRKSKDKESKSPRKGASSGGFMKKVHAGFKGISDLIPSHSKGKGELLVEAVDPEQSTSASAGSKPRATKPQAPRRKSPTKEEIKKMLHEKSSTDTSKSEVTQSSAVPYSDSTSDDSPDEIE